MLFSVAPLPIIDKPSDAAHKGARRSIAQIQYIIMHATVGGFESSLDWLTRNTLSQVSIHRLIDKDGKIYKLVPDNEIANHVGLSSIGTNLVPAPNRAKGQKNPNEVTLGIELVNMNDGKDQYPLVQVRSAALQVTEWWGMYGFLPILSHAQIDTQGKTDPRGFPWTTFYTYCFDILGQYVQKDGPNEQSISSIREQLKQTRARIDALLAELDGT